MFALAAKLLHSGNSGIKLVRTYKHAWSLQECFVQVSHYAAGELRERCSSPCVHVIHSCYTLAAVTSGLSYAESALGPGACWPLQGTCIKPHKLRCTSIKNTAVETTYVGTWFSAMTLGYPVLSHVCRTGESGNTSSLIGHTRASRHTPVELG